MTHRLIVDGELFLHGDVGKVWWDPEAGFDTRDVAEALAELGSGKDITVRLNSGGGFLFEGVGIYNLLRLRRGKTKMVIDGIAASAASVIAMAGKPIVMGDGAMIMIHDPSGVTVGDAEDHRETAQLLDKLGDQAAAILAARSNKSAEEIRDLMLAETWLDADEAIEIGLADEKATVPAETDATAKAPRVFALFDYSKYQHTPQLVMSVGQRTLPPTRKDTTMSKPTPAADPAAVPAVPPAVIAATPPAKLDQTRDILARCKSAKLSLDATMEIVGKADGSLETALGLIVDAMAAADPQPSNTPATVIADEADKRRAGITASLLGKAYLKGGERNEFSSYSLREIARLTLSANAIRVPGDPMEMVKLAFSPRMAAGMHSTSDFVHILADVANKSMLKGFEEAEETFARWTGRGTLGDFKIAKRVDLGLFPNLSEVPEGAEYTYATMSDRGVTVMLATYGKMFNITRQSIINDDLAAFTKIPLRMGRAAKRTIGNLVYAVITANAAMPDGTLLFHADHANLATTAAAPTVASVAAGRAAMALQTDPDGIAEGGLNIRPKFMLVPVELEDTARVLASSEFDPGKSGGERSPNSVRGTFEVVAEARLSSDSDQEWYLAADPNQVDTLEVSYLNGVDTPVLEQRDGWAVDGVEFKVRQDAGVNLLDYRGLYKNAGV